MLMKNVQVVVHESDNGSSFDAVIIKRRFLGYAFCVTIQFLVGTVRMYFMSNKGQRTRKEKEQHLTITAKSRRRYT